MSRLLESGECFGFLHPSIDVHTLGIATASDLLGQCGIRTSIASDEAQGESTRLLEGCRGVALHAWIVRERVGAIGYSYRLDPEDATRHFAAFMQFLERERLFAEAGGPVRSIFFAGLPASCEEVRRRFPRIGGVFTGSETPWETLDVLGVPRSALPSSLLLGARYDEARLQFGRSLVAGREYLHTAPVDRSGSPLYGRRGEKLLSRVDFGRSRGLPPLIRAHAGPYLKDRKEAVSLFIDWAKRLAADGFLDVLSIGTSQLTQSRFGEEWGDAPNGGGVPIHSPEEYGAVWEAARPMLVRTYAGTSRVPELARMHEDRIDIAWHALSLWWFCALDGRGPNSVRDNLDEHFRTMRWIAGTGKPVEPNVPHHFAFRGADDVSYVFSGYAAARAAKGAGVGTLVLQVMLNTPKHTWGVQDLAKARAMLRLVRELESPDFRVLLQPRGGLDYFSPDPETARAQLASVTALMDDIEPHDDSSPQIIHVVSHSEAIGLADPGIIGESIRITRHALSEYRRLRSTGMVDDMGQDADALSRERELVSEVRGLIRIAERAFPYPWSPGGLYAMLKCGFFALPQLALRREEFPAACGLQTRIISGATRIVDAYGVPRKVADREAEIVAEAARSGMSGGGSRDAR